MIATKSTKAVKLWEKKQNRRQVLNAGIWNPYTNNMRASDPLASRHCVFISQFFVVFICWLPYLRHNLFFLNFQTLSKTFDQQFHITNGKIRTNLSSWLKWEPWRNFVFVVLFRIILCVLIYHVLFPSNANRWEVFTQNCIKTGPQEN